MAKSSLKFEIESKTVAEFRSLDKSGELILQPEYQRKVVWPQRAKVSLMETILLGYPIPEIYLAYKTSADGEQTASVVDGQQRLTSLLEFLRNKFPLEELEDDALRESFEGMFFRELPEEVRKEFFEYRFPIRRLSNLADEFVRAVFARVNRVNMVLTDQELRNALLPGPYNDFLKDCAAHQISALSGIFSGGRRQRGGDLEFYAEVFGTCIFGLSNKKKELNERYDKISTDFETYQERSTEFLELLSNLSDIIKWTGRTRWSNIVDMFTLLHVAWGSREKLANANQGQKDQIRDLLDQFQRTVSTIKRDSANGEVAAQLKSLASTADISVTDAEAAVNGYTSGIRNSSDLGSRRARHHQLTLLLSRGLNMWPGD